MPFIDNFVVKVEENGKERYKMTALTKKILIGIAIALVLIAVIVLIIYLVKCRRNCNCPRETFVLYSNENADHNRVNINPEVTYLESYINSALGFSKEDK